LVAIEWVVVLVALLDLLVLSAFLFLEQLVPELLGLLVAEMALVQASFGLEEVVPVSSLQLVFVLWVLIQPELENCLVL
jgi:hypothetical protein